MIKKRILSLDGGGVRGLALAEWLDNMQICAGCQLHEKFDVIVGSSSGGILACMVASGLIDFSFDQTYADEFLKCISDIFPRGGKRFWNRIFRTFKQGLSAPKYDHKPIERVLKKYFGDMKLGELKTRVLLTTYDTAKRSALVLKSDDPRFKDIPVWEACMATAAAPTFFPAKKLVLAGGHVVSAIDGGLVANNPALCGLVDVIDDEISCLNVVVVSMGVRFKQLPISLNDAQEWGLLEWALRGQTSPIIDVAFDGPDDANDYITRKLLGSRYIRFNIDTWVQLDASDYFTLRKLRVDASDYIKCGLGKPILHNLLTWL